MAGLAGSLYAHYMQFISAGDFSFPVSVGFLSMLVLGGMGTLWGPLIGTIILGILPEVFRPLVDYRVFLYTLLLLLMIRFQPGGLLGEGSAARRVLAPLFRGGRTMSDALLSVRGVSRHFGGLKAVDAVDFDLFPGEILGILGPNGAGKTVLFNLDLRDLHAVSRRHPLSRNPDRRSPPALDRALGHRQDVSDRQALWHINRSRKRARRTRDHPLPEPVVHLGTLANAG